MWILLRIKPINSNGATQLSSSTCIMQSLIHAHYSTKSTKKVSKPHFMVSYLVASLGFSKDQAFSISSKVNHLKSTQKPDSVLHFLNQCGLDKTQIKRLVCSSPKILTASVDKTLEPKFRVLHKLGFPGSSLEKLLKPSLNFSTNRLIGNVNYLRNLLKCDDKVIRVIHKSWWMLASNFAEKLPANLLVLKKYGLSNDKIETMLLKKPGCLLQTPEWLEASIKKVEPVLGVSCKSPRFVDAIEVVASLSKSKMDAKFGIFRSFGWSDLEILTMARTLPFCLRKSEAKLQDALEFFMNKLGYKAAYLATHPKLLVYSLEKRVMPRNNVLEILKQKNLSKYNFSLCSVVARSEVNFVKDFVLPYHELVPHLYETYTNSTGHPQTIK